MTLRNTILLTVICIVNFSCKDKYEASQFYSSNERDSLLTDLITYVYIRPRGSDAESRFDLKFRKYYTGQLPYFTLEKYFQDNEGNHYFFLIRPARSSEGTKRGVGGTFRMDNAGEINSFKEVFNTPVLPLPILNERGAELFNYLVKKGDVKDYEKNPDYIEWPNDMTYYDTLKYEWKIKPGI